MDKEGKVVGGRTSNNETASWNLVAEKKKIAQGEKNVWVIMKRTTEQRTLDGIATLNFFIVVFGSN